MPKNQQYYLLTLEEALAQYQCGLISATALLYYYLKIRLKPGWKLTLHQREISQQLGISKAAFYKGIQRLKDQHLIDWEAPNGLVVSLEASLDRLDPCEAVAQTRVPLDETEAIGQTGDFLDKSETVGQTGDSLDKSETIGQTGDSLDKLETPLDKLETRLDKSETPLDKLETATLVKPFSRLASSDPPYSYQIFNKSLSDSVREKFFTFVREKTKGFANPINDLEGWLAASNQAGQERWRVYYTMFQNEVKDALALNQDWANHPQREEWIEQIRLGKPRFIALGGPDSEREQRLAFADWAIANKLVWGAES